MSLPTLRQLRYLDALARHVHFGRAAEACSISQPALSVQIRDLEQELGGPLLERGARQVRLTPLGEGVVMRARAILQSVDELMDFARAEQTGFSGRLRLGMIPTVAPYLLPRIVRGLAEAYPALDIHVRESVTPRLLQDLSDGQLDAAVVALPVLHPNLSEELLLEESFLLVQPSTAAGEVTDLAEMKGARLLLLEEGHCFREQALAFCKLRALQPREMLDASSLSTLVQMVGAGLGVTLIPEMAVPIETRSAPVVVTRLTSPPPSRTIGMVWRRSSPLSRQLGDVASVLRGIVDHSARRPGVQTG